MSVTSVTLLCTLAVALTAIGALYYTGRSFSVAARERAIEEAKRPLRQEISDLRGEMADLRRDKDNEVAVLRRDNDYLRRRVDELTDELRQHR